MGMYKSISLVKFKKKVNNYFVFWQIKWHLSLFHGTGDSPHGTLMCRRTVVGKPWSNSGLTVYFAEFLCCSLLCFFRIHWSWGSQPYTGRWRWCRCRSRLGPTPQPNTNSACYTLRRAFHCGTTIPPSCRAKRSRKHEVISNSDSDYVFSQHRPVVWDGEPSHGNVVTLGAKLQQQEEVRGEGRGEGELNSWHHAQLVALHQQPAQEDPQRHHWEVQHTWHTHRQNNNKIPEELSSTDIDKLWPVGQTQHTRLSNPACYTLVEIW